MGFSDGQFDMNYQCNAAYTKDSMVILDFGGATNSHGTSNYGGYATLMFGGSYEPLENIVGATESYAQGWYASTTTCARLNVAIGTNNSLACGLDSVCSTNAGSQFSNAANAINNWLTSQGYSWQILAGAANDFESFSSSGRSAPARSFVTGFNSVAGSFLLNYGSADGCPTSGATNCSYGWTLSDYQYVSWSGRSWPIPENHQRSGVQANQWANIKAHYPMTFLGVMSEVSSGDPIPSWGSPACVDAGGVATNCDTESWTQLYTRMNNLGIGQSIDFLLNVRWR